MTDKFRLLHKDCPSKEAVAAFGKVAGYPVNPNGIYAAMAVDVPRIVRAEVERALRARQADPLGFGVAAYLTERYGPQSATAELSLATPQPRVSDVLNERLELREWQKTEVWLSREEVERRFGVKVTPDGQTQAERDFLRELAAAHLKQWGEAVIWNPTPADRANVNLCAAARRVVEEAK